MKYITVNELNLQIKSIIEETFIETYVTGECSRVTKHSSGHIYFSLKDEKSTIRCVLFRSYANKLKFNLKESLKINIKGNISLYTPRGEYQIIVTEIEPYGKGSLALAYEQLKNELQNLGYFEKKREIPKFPSKIAIITSKSGAVIEDMKHVATSRYPLVKFLLYDTVVQGVQAETIIAGSIRRAQSSNADIIVIARGGGSLEDLWCFNTRKVCDEIHNSQIPVVSAIGHEIDFTLSDFTADVRAPTPSAAMEIILPSKEELFLYIISLLDTLNSKKQQIIKNKTEKIKNLFLLLEQRKPKNRILNATLIIKNLKKDLYIKINSKLLKYQNQYKNIDKYNIKNNINNKIEILQNDIKNLKSLYILKKKNLYNKNGYTQISINGKVKNLNDINVNDNIELQDPQFIVIATVKSKKKL